jgi:hypothetical protein
MKHALSSGKLLLASQYVMIDMNGKRKITSSTNQIKRNTT